MQSEHAKEKDLYKNSLHPRASAVRRLCGVNPAMETGKTSTLSQFPHDEDDDVNDEDDDDDDDDDGGGGDDDEDEGAED